MSQSTEALSFARQYRARGWRPVPVPFREKGPVIDEWQKLRLDPDDLPRYFRGKCNVGVLTGEPSGGLVDVDLDHPLAVELAPLYLPATGCKFGRAGKLRSHWIYQSAGATTHQRSTGKVQGMLVELRSTGVQTVFPGSIHESGEPIEWAEGGEPAVVDPAALRAAVDALADEVERRLGLRSGDGLVEDADLPDTSAWSAKVDQQAEGLKPGVDFNARGDLGEVLRRNGWVLVRQQSDGVERWRRPGKDHGISASLKDGKAFYCFTSSTSIPDSLQSKRGYSPFAVLAYLEHGGDFQAAAKALAAKGYGTPPKSKQAPAARKLVLPDAFQPFPVDILPPVCAEFVRQSAASIDCDECMVALPLLGAIAAAIGNSCRIQLKRDYSEPSVIWAAVVCESGSRKSAAVDAPIRPIRKREGEEIKKFRKLVESYLADVQTYKVASAQWQRKGHKDGEPPPVEPERPICRRFTVSDVTTEALAVRLEQNARGLLLVRDELAGFFTGLNQYKSGGKGADEAAFLAMHGARALVIDRKNPDKPSIYVPLANLSVAGAIQPGILRRLLTRDRMESGMTARFLFAYPPPRAVRWREKAVDAALQDRLATMFDWLLGLALKTDEQTNEPAPVMLPLTPEAKKLWIAFHDEHAAEQAELHGDLSAAWAKLTGYAARLSLVCELAAWASSAESFDPPTEVGVEAIRAGITLARWFSAEAKRIYAILEESDEQAEARELVDYIRRHGGSVTARDLAHGPRRYRGNQDAAEAALNMLAKAGAGRWVGVPGDERGGPATRQLVLVQPGAGSTTPLNPAENMGSGAGATTESDDDEVGEWSE